MIVPFQCSAFESSLEAFRFVSLLPLEENKDNRRWNCFHSFIAKGSGDIEDHCTLLCSFLLGFGLDAYIVIGNYKEDRRIWILTRETMISSPLKIIYYWEPITGQRFESSNPNVKKYCNTISCVFNNKVMYANLQANNGMDNVSYDFEDRKYWSGLEVSSLVSPWSFPIKLFESTINTIELEEQIEVFLKDKICYYRESTLMSRTEFDESMSYILTPAVSKWEIEKVYELKSSQEELVAAIYNVIPDGHIFKAFPVETRSINPQEVFSNVMQNKITKNMIDTNSNELKFALKTKVTPYPEKITVVWTILAITYSD